MCQNVMVKTVVDGLVNKGYMFTAFDVTKFLRTSGNRVRHDEVNDAVKQMFRDGEMPDYEKDIKDVGADVAPFVYYHRNSDISNYQADWIENNPDQDGMLNDADPSNSSNSSGVSQPTPSNYGAPVVHTAPANVVVNSVVNPTVKPVLPSGVKATDKEGRLYISPIITNSVGFDPGQDIYISDEVNRLIIGSNWNNSSWATWATSVNADGRIRICRSVLKKIAPTNPIGYMIAAQFDKIVVTPA